AAGVIFVTVGDQTLSVTDANGLTASATVTVTAPPEPPGGGGGTGMTKDKFPENQGSPAPYDGAGLVVEQVVPSGAADKEFINRRQARLQIEEAVDQLFASGSEQPLGYSVLAGRGRG